MEGIGAIFLFILGIVLGCVIVMLLWIAHPGCIALPAWAGGTGTQAGTASNFSYTGGAYTNIVIRDQGGRTIATTGDKGTESTFTDENGNTKNVLCYMSYYCVDQTPCEEEQCIEKGRQCSTAGYANAVSAANQCCAPYECINGYCGETQTCVKTGGTCTSDANCCEGQCVNGICGQEECQKQDALCGYVYPTQTTTVYTNQQPTYYGECCDPFQCINNKCTPQEECVQTGKTCGRVQDPSVLTAVVYKDYGECCPPEECVANLCTTEEPCIKTGAMCGYGPTTSSTYTNVASRPWYGDCCEGNICTDGYCRSQCAAVNEKCSSAISCCGGYNCVDGVCRSTSCAAEAQTCAVGQIDCCAGFYCVSGKCGGCEPGGYSCSADSQCCEGYTCQNERCAKYQPCVGENAECSKDSECCSGLFCYDGICKEEGTCGEQGQTCGLGVECCDGFTCSDNDVCVACADEGSTCGGQTGGLSCCSGAYCYSGRCKAQTGHLCDDSEAGPNYYEEGSATGEYKGDYGTYTDYCSSLAGGTLFEYYCEVSGEYSEVLLAQITCPEGCTAGECNQAN